MPARRAGAVLTTLLVVLLAVPASVLAQSPGNPLSPGIPVSPAPTTTTATPTIISTSTSTNSGLSGADAIFIAVGAVVVLAGISFFIWRDARRRAPVRRHAAVDGADGRARTGSKPRTKPRKLSPAERRRRKRGRAR